MTILKVDLQQSVVHSNRKRTWRQGEGREGREGREREEREGGREGGAEGEGKRVGVERGEGDKTSITQLYVYIHVIIQLRLI